MNLTMKLVCKMGVIHDRIERVRMTITQSRIKIRVDGLGWHALSIPNTKVLEGRGEPYPITPFEYSGTCHPTQKLKMDRAVVPS